MVALGRDKALSHVEPKPLVKLGFGTARLHNVFLRHKERCVAQEFIVCQIFGLTFCGLFLIPINYGLQDFGLRR